MNLTYEKLVNNSLTNLDRAGGDVAFDLSDRLTQQAIAYSLIAIAQELHQINEGQKLEPIKGEVLSTDSPWSISPGTDSTAK